MTVKSVITKPETNEAVWLPGRIRAPLIGVTTQPSVFGRFKTASLTETGNSIIVTPPGDESIVLTDLIVTAEKKNLGIDTLRFYDGTNTVDIIIASVADSPVNIAIGFQGCWQGWKDAYLQLVQTGANHYANVAVGYYFMPKETTHAYAEWNSLRDSR